MGELTTGLDNAQSASNPNGNMTSAVRIGRGMQSGGNGGGLFSNLSGGGSQLIEGSDGFSNVRNLGGTEGMPSDLFNNRVSQSGGGILSFNRNANTSGGSGGLFSNLGGRDSSNTNPNRNANTSGGSGGLFSNLGGRDSSNTNPNLESRNGVGGGSGLFSNGSSLFGNLRGRDSSNTNPNLEGRNGEGGGGSGLFSNGSSLFGNFGNLGGRDSSNTNPNLGGRIGEGGGGGLFSNLGGHSGSDSDSNSESNSEEREENEKSEENEESRYGLFSNLNAKRGENGLSTGPLSYPLNTAGEEGGLFNNSTNGNNQQQGGLLSGGGSLFSGATYPMQVTSSAAEGKAPNYLFVLNLLYCFSEPIYI